MNTKWNYKSWQKDFFNMKSYSSSDWKLLMGGVKGLKDALRLVVHYVEYERVRWYKRKIIDSVSKIRAIKNIYFQELYFLLLIESQYKIQNALRSALVI